MWSPPGKTSSGTAPNQQVWDRGLFWAGRMCRGGDTKHSLLGRVTEGGHREFCRQRHVPCTRFWNEENEVQTGQVIEPTLHCNTRISKRIWKPLVLITFSGTEMSEILGLVPAGCRAQVQTEWRELSNCYPGMHDIQRAESPVFHTLCL